MYQRELNLAVGQTSPDIVMHVYEDDSTTGKDGTGVTAVKFYVRDMETETLVIDGGTATLLQANPMQLKRVIADETAAEVENGEAWFTYTLNEKTEHTTTFGFTVSQPWKRRG